MRIEAAQFVDGVAQPFGLAIGALDVGAMALDGDVARTALVPQPRHIGGIGTDAAIGVEQSAVRRGVDEGTLVMLAVNFDQSRSQRAQNLDADRLVVDEGARPAVGKLRPAHDQFVFADKVVVGQHAPRRMVLGDVEGGNHLAVLGALAHQSRVAAGAERQRKGVEQDRFAGAGLARQCGEAGAEIDIEPVDQNDVADGKASQHRMTDNRGRTTDIIRDSYVCPLSFLRRQPLCGALAKPIFWKARLIQEPLFSVVGTPPAFFTRL